MEISEQARELRNAYYRKWRSENKDKVSAANRKYRETHKEERAQNYNSYWEKKAAEAAKTAEQEQ